MSERITRTGSPGGIPFRVESDEKKRRVEETEKTSPHIGIKKEPRTDVFESTQEEQKEGSSITPDVAQIEEEEPSEIAKDKKEEDSQESIDIYA
ncbi:MAG: hypothetical protein ABH837_00120 [bacterium]